MPKKCQICNQAPATVHLTNIKNNVKNEMHMCESCAEKNGVHIHKTVSFEKVFTPKKGTALNSVDFVLNSEINHSEEKQKKADVVCEKCGMKWREFRKGGRLGCPNDYKVFKKGLLPLLDEIHSSTSHNVGKVPDVSEQENRYKALIELKRKLRDAIAKEEYEDAARLRDEIDVLNNSED